MEINIRLKLGKRIKELRKKCEYTQEKLSAVAEIDYKYLRRIEGKNRGEGYYWGPITLKIESISERNKLKFSPTSGRKPDTLLSSPQRAHLAILYAKVR